LEQEEALQYLRGWLQHHPKYGMLVPHDAVDRLNHTEVRILSSSLTITSILDKMKLWS
jgi:peroxin-5